MEQMKTHLRDDVCLKSDTGQRLEPTVLPPNHYCCMGQKQGLRERRRLIRLRIQMRAL